MSAPGNFTTTERDAMRQIMESHGYDGALQLLAETVREIANDEDPQTKAAMRHVAMSIDRVRRNA